MSQMPGAGALPNWNCVLNVSVNPPLVVFATVVMSLILLKVMLVTEPKSLASAIVSEVCCIQVIAALLTPVSTCWVVTLPHVGLQAIDQLWADTCCTVVRNANLSLGSNGAMLSGTPQRGALMRSRVDWSTIPVGFKPELTCSWRTASAVR